LSPSRQRLAECEFDEQRSSPGETGYPGRFRSRCKGTVCGGQSPPPRGPARNALKKGLEGSNSQVRRNLRRTKIDLQCVDRCWHTFSITDSHIEITLEIVFQQV